MKILVTGGTGFVGSNLTNELVKIPNYEVVITGNSTEVKRNPSARILNLHLNGIDWTELQNVEAVFHQAADNDTQSQNYREMFKANVWSSIELFERMYEQGCRNFVFASSTAIYGDNPAPYFEESKVEPNPLTFYAKSKLEFEKWVFDWASNNDANVVGLRYCNVYGPGEYHKGKRASMIYQLINQMMFDRAEPKIFKDGEQRRDWIYVKDVVNANLLALDYASKGNSGIFNMGTGVATSFNEIINIINENLFPEEPGAWFKPEYINCSFVDSFQSHTQCDMKKAETLLGFRSKWSIKSGINDFMNYI